MPAVEPSRQNESGKPTQVHAPSAAVIGAPVATNGGGLTEESSACDPESVADPASAVADSAPPASPSAGAGFEGGLVPVASSPALSLASAPVDGDSDPGGCALP